MTSHRLIATPSVNDPTLSDLAAEFGRDVAALREVAESEGIVPYVFAGNERVRVVDANALRRLLGHE